MPQSVRGDCACPALLASGAALQLVSWSFQPQLHLHPTLATGSVESTLAFITFIVVEGYHLCLSTEHL
jgi:hypothetical protein